MLQLHCYWFLSWVHRQIYPKTFSTWSTQTEAILSYKLNPQPVPGGGISISEANSNRKLFHNRQCMQRLGKNQLIICKANRVRGTWRRGAMCLARATFQWEEAFSSLWCSLIFHEKRKAKAFFPPLCSVDDLKLHKVSVRWEWLSFDEVFSWGASRDRPAIQLEKPFDSPVRRARGKSFRVKLKALEREGKKFSS